MNAEMSEVFYPDTINYANLEEQVRTGADKINDNGSLSIDFSNIKEASTVTICFIIEMLRVAKSRQAHVSVLNAGKQLDKLLELYQLSNIVKSISG